MTFLVFFFCFWESVGQLLDTFLVLLLVCVCYAFENVLPLDTFVDGYVSHGAIAHQTRTDRPRPDFSCWARLASWLMHFELWSRKGTIIIHLENNQSTRPGLMLYSQLSPNASIQFKSTVVQSWWVLVVWISTWNVPLRGKWWLLYDSRIKFTAAWVI